MDPDPPDAPAPGEAGAQQGRTAAPEDQPGTPEPPVAESAAARVRYYARMAMNYGFASGVLIVAGAAYLARVLDSGSADRLDYLIVALLLIFGVGQGVLALIRYRQLSRYLRTGSASKLEDLVLAARKARHPPPR